MPDGATIRQSGGLRLADQAATLTVKSSYLEVGMPTTRERLHEMVNLLLEDRLLDAETALTPLLDPVGLAFLNAPEEDEETTAEDIADLEATRAEFERGETVTLEEAMRLISEPHIANR
jgi:hypothetical protein